MDSNLEVITMSSNNKGSGILQILEVFNYKLLTAFFRFNNLYVVPLGVWELFIEIILLCW